MKDLKILAKECIAALRAAGADRAQCTASLTETREFNVDGGEFSLFRTLFNTHLTLVAYREGRRGTTSLNRFDPDAIREAVQTCLSMTETGDSDPAWEIAGHIGEREFCSGSPEGDIDGLFARTRELMDTVKQEYPRIMMEQLIVSHWRGDSVYADTSDNLYHDLSGAYEISLMFSAHEGERTSSFFDCGFTCKDLATPFIECALVRRSLSDVEKQIDTQPLSGKFTGTVIFAPDCLGQMLSSVIGNFASGAGLFDGTSIWRDKLGQTVADPAITVSLAPHDPAIVCGDDYTSDGFLTEDFDLIKNGVLQSFEASAYVANKAGCPRSPNTSDALVLPAGDKTLEELIASVDHGLLVARFSGGAPSSNGDFSGVAKNSFLIEHGKITCAVSETMISGNLAEMLYHPCGFTRERMIDGNTCLPYGAFSGIVISGK